MIVLTSPPPHNHLQHCHSTEGFVCCTSSSDLHPAWDVPYGRSAMRVPSTCKPPHEPRNQRRTPIMEHFIANYRGLSFRFDLCIPKVGYKPLVSEAKDNSKDNKSSEWLFQSQLIMISGSHTLPTSHVNFPKEMSLISSPFLSDARTITVWRKSRNFINHRPKFEF